MKKNSIVGYDANPKNFLAQTVLYNNMSHHYRRLYNAKPCVDTGLRTTKQKDRHSSNSLIVGKGYYPQRNSIENRISPTNLSIAYSKVQKFQENKPKDILDGIMQIPYRPRILKTDVESKLRSLRNYHPPRKKISSSSLLRKKKKETTTEACDDEEVHYEEDWLEHPDNMRSVSKHGSSSDSAYTEEGEGMWSRGESRDGTPQDEHQPTQTRSEDSPYIRFVRSITDEVLRKGIYTNKALKRVFQEHINRNRGILNNRRMQEEVEKLQDDLGIPKEDDLDELDYGLGGGTLSVSPDLEEVEEKERQLLDSLDRLSVEEQPVDVELTQDEWLAQTESLTFRNSNEKDNTRSLALKLPLADDDNDSSIGYDMDSECSDVSADVKSDSNGPVLV